MERKHRSRTLPFEVVRCYILLTANGYKLGLLVQQICTECARNIFAFLVSSLYLQQFSFCYYPFFFVHSQNGMSSIFRQLLLQFFLDAFLLLSHSFQSLSYCLPLPLISFFFSKKLFARFVYFETLSIHCNEFKIESRYTRTFHFSLAHSFRVRSLVRLNYMLWRECHLEIAQSHAFKVLFSYSFHSLLHSGPALSLFLYLSFIRSLPYSYWGVCSVNSFFCSSNANACFLTFSFASRTTCAISLLTIFPCFLSLFSYCTLFVPA